MITAYKKVDIVIPLGSGSTRNDLELRLALRSIAENVLDCGNIYIVSTDPPAWLNNVRIISCADVFRHNKDGNIIRKLLAACQMRSLSGEFVFWSDDQLAMQNFYLRWLPAVHNCRSEKDFSSDRILHRRMRHTFEYLRKHNIVLPYNFDSHLPQRINKDLFCKIMEKLDYAAEPGFCVNTIYFGLAKIPSYISQESVKATFERTVILEKLPENKLFIGYNDKAMAGNLSELLLKHFNKQCKYEKFF